uniref:Uncharacterized protein n=1 Tax=Arundo donax TaxID=35708 RepID=A0A0A8ZHT1_ARUDO
MDKVAHLSKESCTLPCKICAVNEKGKECRDLKRKEEILVYDNAE